MGKAGGELKAKKGEERGTRKGEWQIRKKSEWAAALGSKRYFLSLFWKRFRRGFSLERCRQAPKNGHFNPSTRATLDFPLPQGSQKFRG
jgi:hypothetical protein